MTNVLRPMLSHPDEGVHPLAFSIDETLERRRGDSAGGCDPRRCGSRPRPGPSSRPVRAEMQGRRPTAAVLPAARIASSKTLPNEGGCLK